MGALARVPIVKEGWVLKRNKQGAPLNSSKKKYLTLTEDGHLAYYASKSDFSEDKDRKVVDVIRITGKLHALKTSFYANTFSESAWQIRAAQFKGRKLV